MTDVQEKKRRRPPTGGGRAAGFGRVKGTPNKATQEIRTITRALTFQNSTYVERIRKGLEKGTLEPSVEVRILEYAWGKTKQEVEITIPENPALKLARVFYDSLTPEERTLALSLAERRLALRASLGAATVIDVKPNGD
jgi:hypothetical protein